MNKLRHCHTVTKLTNVLHSAAEESLSGDMHTVHFTVCPPLTSFETFHTNVSDSEQCLLKMVGRLKQRGYGQPKSTS